MLYKKSKFLVLLCIVILILSLSTHYIYIFFGKSIEDKNKFESISISEINIEDDGFIVIDTLEVNDENIYFGYYEDSFFEIKIKNKDSINTIYYLIDSWEDLSRTYNIEDILSYHSFELHWVPDCMRKDGMFILIDYITYAGGGIYRIWTFSITDNQIRIIDWSDWWPYYDFYITRNTSETLIFEIPFLDIKESISLLHDDSIKYLDYLNFPLNQRSLYHYDYYFNTVGCHINDDSMVVSYRFRTGAHDWIPDLNITYKFVNGIINIVDANLTN